MKVVFKPKKKNNFVSPGCRIIVDTPEEKDVSLYRQMYGNLFWEEIEEDQPPKLIDGTKTKDTVSLKEKQKCSCKWENVLAKGCQCGGL